MMDLDEAIQHCKEQVQEQAKRGCYSCAEEHQQLAEWLKDYKRLLSESRSEIPNTCGDAISRQAVLDAMYELCSTGETLKENPWRDNPHIDGVVEAIEALPSVSPQPETGRWIEVIDEIRAEIHATAEMHEDGDYYLRDEWIDEIIDKYKAESEEKE